MSIIGMDTEAIFVFYDEINRWLTESRTGVEILERSSNDLRSYWMDARAERVGDGLRDSIKKIEGLLDRLETLNHRMWKEMDEWLMADGMGESRMKTLKGATLLGKPPEPEQPRETTLSYYATVDEDEGGGGLWGWVKDRYEDAKDLVITFDEHVIDPIADGITGIFTPASAAPDEIKGKLPPDGLLVPEARLPGSQRNERIFSPGDLEIRMDILNRDDAIPSNAIPSNAIPSNAIPSNIISPADLVG